MVQRVRADMGSGRVYCARNRVKVLERSAHERGEVCGTFFVSIRSKFGTEAKGHFSLGAIPLNLQSRSLLARAQVHSCLSKHRFSASSQESKVFTSEQDG